VAGGGTVGWPWHRRLVSQGASLACRGLLGVPLRDVTGGFKCWRRQVLEELPLEEIRCRGFAFQIEMNYLCWRAGYCMAEVPVTFVSRRQGRSKLSLAITLEAAALLWRLSLGTPSLRRR
jgi:dolichol-phosphate mannosyltransferase